MFQNISHFNSIQELQDSMDKRIKDLENEIELQSKIIGDKIREGEKDNAEELSDLKSKLNSGNNKDKKTDNKRSNTNKKSPAKKKSKKGKSESWIDYENLRLYNGVGTRGELELYFKSLEEMKIELENLKKTRKSLSKLMNSGIKKELAGVGYEHQDGPFELAFVKTDLKREKFSFKSILTVACE